MARHLVGVDIYTEIQVVLHELSLIFWSPDERHKELSEKVNKELNGRILEDIRLTSSILLSFACLQQKISILSSFC